MKPFQKFIIKYISHHFSDSGHVTATLSRTLLFLSIYRNVATMSAYDHQKVPNKRTFFMILKRTLYISFGILTVCAFPITMYSEIGGGFSVASGYSYFDDTKKPDFSYLNFKSKTWITASAKVGVFFYKDILAAGILSGYLRR